MKPLSATAMIEGLRLCSPEDLENYRTQLLSERDPSRRLIIVCHGTGCLANGSDRVADALRRAIRDCGADASVVPEIKTTGCHGFCSRGPLVIMEPEGIFYQKVQPEDAEEIVRTTVLEHKPVERLLYKDAKTGDKIAHHNDIPFYKHQQRHVLRKLGHIDPTTCETPSRPGATGPGQGADGVEPVG
jgi:NADH-quinone oxidoreductase subunit F